jgi:hypothetical protein
LRGGVLERWRRPFVAGTETAAPLVVPFAFVALLAGQFPPLPEVFCVSPLANSAAERLSIR